MSETTKVVCAIIVRDNRILATRRGKSSSRSGKWEFPGGKVHEDETYEEAIKREIREELNITIKTVKQFPFLEYDYSDIRIRLIPIFCNWIKGSIKLHDHDRYEWIPINQFYSYDWSEADKLLFIVIKDIFQEPDELAV